MTNDHNAMTSESSAESQATTALFEIEPGVAVLYGEDVPAGLELVPFTLIDHRTQKSLSTAIAQASGLFNVATQGANGLMQAQGLVRLAPQTLKQLETARPLMSGGWNLGGLASEGKIVAQVRWLPAGGASAASVVASLGAALPMLAIQLQLSEITALAKHNLELTSKVLQTVRQDHWATTTGNHQALTREIENAKHVGAVTDAIWKNVRGHQTSLDAQWDLFRRKLQGHVSDLNSKRGHKARRQFLLDDGEAILADAHALVLAQSSWFMYQALRAGHLFLTAETDSQDDSLLKKLVEDSRERHARALTETDWLLEQVSREFAIIGELDGKRTFKIGGEHRAAADVARMTRRLQEALAAIRAKPATQEAQALNVPTTNVFKENAPEELLRVLRLRLEPTERLLALADASCDLWSWDVRDAGWIALTDQRLLVMKQDSFRRLGVIDEAFDVTDIRYVRVRDQGRDKGPAFDLVTRDKDLTVKFHPWAKDGSQRRQAERFAAILSTFMHIPTSEVPDVRIPELGPALDIAGELE